MKLIKTKRCRALIAFGDTSGFNAFADRVNTSSRNFESFCVALTRAFLNFQKLTGYFTKPIGDGCMIVKEIPAHANGKVTMEFLRNLDILRGSVEGIIEDMRHSAPDLFLLRAVAGPVLRLSWGKDKDYFGRAVNKAERLKSIGRSIPIIGHSSVYALLADKQIKEENIEVLDMPVPRDIPRGLNDSDVMGAKAFRFR